MTEQQATATEIAVWVTVCVATWGYALLKIGVALGIL